MIRRRLFYCCVWWWLATASAWIRRQHKILPPRGGSLDSRISESTPTVPPLQNDSAVLSHNHTTKLTPHTNSTTTATKLPAWRCNLPESLCHKTALQKVSLGNIDIYLLGTAHVSNDSARDVSLLLEHLSPNCILVELCDARIPLLEGDDHGGLDGYDGSNATTTSFWEQLKQTQQTQGGSKLQALSTVLLTSVQEDYANTLGVELGGEFRRAHEYWQSSPQCRLVLGDRPLHVTLYRAWESLTWWPKFKVVVGLLWSSLRKPNPEEMKQWLESVLAEESDVLAKSFQELRAQFPTLYTTIISERDAWLAAKLVQTSRILASSRSFRPTIVAIVGAGHVPGICKWLTSSNHTQSPEQVLAELVTTKKWAKDEMIQQQIIPSWVQEVPELPRMLP